jgi:hypothetical protein
VLVLSSKLSCETWLTSKKLCYFPRLFEANAGILGRARLFPSPLITDNPVSDTGLPVITVNYSKKIDTSCSRRAPRIFHWREGGG